MPIRVTEGIPITFPVSTPDDTFSDAYNKARKLYALDLQRSEQDAAAWCYAACAEMVINYSHNAIVSDQCQVVSFVKRGKNELDFCCLTDGVECIESGCSLADIGSIFDFWRIGHVTVDLAANPNGAITTLGTELEAGRPIEIVVDWKEGGSHAVLIIAVQDDWFFIIDPLEDDPLGGWHTEASLLDGFGKGIWAKTWISLRRIH